MVARVPVSEKPYMGMPTGRPTAANHRRPSEMRGGGGGGGVKEKEQIHLLPKAQPRAI